MKSGEIYTETASFKNARPSTLPPTEAISTQHTDQQSPTTPKCQVPEGSITEYTYMRYILYTRSNPGNLKCTHMPPNTQQYKMHECCKAVNELQAMTSVISRYHLSILSTYSVYPTFQQFHGTPSAWMPGVTLRLDLGPNSITSRKYPLDSIWDPIP